MDRPRTRRVVCVEKKAQLREGSRRSGGREAGRTEERKGGREGGREAGGRRGTETCVVHKAKLLVREYTNLRGFEVRQEALEVPPNNSYARTEREGQRVRKHERYRESQRVQNNKRASEVIRERQRKRKGS